MILDKARRKAQQIANQTSRDAFVMVDEDGDYFPIPGAYAFALQHMRVFETYTPDTGAAWKEAR